MGVRKISVSLDQAVYEVAVEQAEAAGVSLSAWLSRAARHEARIAAGLRAVVEWEADNGALTAEEIAWADGVLGYSGTAQQAS
ncbi:MAG: hypothetical protein HYR62_04080 [Actinobacteria bacterium]|nr:hypothetical protein [Actinomycetota bacterium]MBI3686696.1 hypothetical protein [Actinomycetota bacterium]